MLLILLAACTAVGAGARDQAAAVDAAAAAAGAEPGPASYYRQVRPIFQAHCHGCHQPAKPSGDFVMTSFEPLLRGGESESAAIVPGKPDQSHLVEMITPVAGKAEMPDGKPPLSAAQIELVSGWIRAGAVDDTPAGARVQYDQDHPPVYQALPIITALDFSPDGVLLAVSGYHEVLLHEVASARLLARLIGMSERIEAVVFSPDGKWLAVTGGAPARLGEVQIWDVASRALKLSVAVTFDTVYGASWSPDSKYVAFGCADNSVRAIDAVSGQQVVLQRAATDWTLATTFSTDGSHIVSTGRDMTVKLTDFKTQRFIDNITSITPGALKGGILALARHPQRDEVLVGGDDGVCRSYRLFRKTARRIGDDSNLIRQFPPVPGRVFDVAYSRDARHAVAGSSFNGTGEVTVFALAYAWEIPKAIAAIQSKTVAQRTAEERAALVEYHTSGVHVSARMAGQKGAVYALAIHPDGAAVASGGYDGMVRLNEMSTGKLLGDFAPVPLTQRPEVAQAGATK